MTATEIAIVGVGKIARDQHVPSIAANPAFSLAATVSGSGGLDGVENHATLEALLAARPDIGAVALCMPPQFRYAAARAALAAGRHVLLEKPPGATLAEVEALKVLATEQGVSLFATWHSRFAAGVKQAREWLADKGILKVDIVWKEDVRRWHPGQAWIWQAGGLGVFDPGINALSILTEILPMRVHLTSASLEFPEGRDAPIAADLRLTDGGGADVHAVFDWRQTGPQTWTIEVETQQGRLVLSQGGAQLAIEGAAVVEARDREYEGIYARFAELIESTEIDVDLSPLTHVADAFMLGRRIVVEPFED
ncbi:MAG: Gfo/Idh/MocA family oxidoreductase [Mesorhizobium sp.]|nr:Gfo/Idh/MocA family oxidoreductase [Mesorhizobium sp.]